MPDDLDAQIAHLENRIAETGRVAEAESKMGLSDDAIEKEMGEVFDRHQEQGERAKLTDPEMPIDHSAKNWDQVVEASYDWAHTKPAERQLMARADQELRAHRVEAERHGLTVEQYEAVRQTLNMERAERDRSEQRQQAQQQQPQQPANGQWVLPPTFSEALPSARELYPQVDPGTLLNNYLNIDRYMRADPVAGLQWIAGQYGVDFGQLTGQQRPAQVTPEISSAVSRFLDEHPEADSDDLIGVLRNGEIRIDKLNPIETLNRALEHLERKAPNVFAEKKKRARGKHAAAKLDRSRSLESSMAAAYDVSVSR